MQPTLFDLSEFTSTDPGSPDSAKGGSKPAVIRVIIRVESNSRSVAGAIANLLAQVSAVNATYLRDPDPDDAGDWVVGREITVQLHEELKAHDQG